MTALPGGSTKSLSQKALPQLVLDLAGKLESFEQELSELRTHNQALQEEVGRLRLDNGNLHARNQALKDEIARLKTLPPRPPFKPSGMEKATQPRPAGPDRRPGRGAKRDRVTREVTLRIEVPPGSRFKGYKTVVRRDLILAAEVVRYKRQVVRLLTADLEPFAHEDRAILKAGLVSSPFITVDDTGARHARRPGVTTQIGVERYCVFRTSRSKSRLNFLSLLRGGCEDYVVNEATLDYLRAQPVEGAVIARLAAHPGQVFHSQMEWWQHLLQGSINIFDRR